MISRAGRPPAGSRSIPPRSPWHTEHCHSARACASPISKPTQCGGRGKRSRPVRVRPYCRPVRSRGSPHRYDCRWRGGSAPRYSSAGERSLGAQAQPATPGLGRSATVAAAALPAFRDIASQRARDCSRKDNLSQRLTSGEIVLGEQGLSSLSDQNCLKPPKCPSARQTPLQEDAQGFQHRTQQE